MKALFSALIGVYTRWRFVEDIDDAPRRAKSDAPVDEVGRLRLAIERERRNLASYRRYELSALAGPCESSIRAMETRIHALELGTRRAV